MKKSTNKSMSKVLATFATVFAFLSFFGCDIGLGPAVDVEAPRVEITSPSTNATVGASFTIHGISMDDAEVTSVEIIRIYRKDKDESGNVTVVQWPTEEEINRGVTLGRVVPKFNNDTRSWEWNVSLSYVGERTYKCNDYTLNGLSDGNYIVDSRSYDGFNRPSTIASRSFDIDNTKPVFLLSSPAELQGSAGRTEYGRSVTVRGVIADAHAVNTMTVRAFDKSFNEIPLAKNIFTDFDKANVNISIAAYSTAVASGSSVKEDGKVVTDEDRILHENYMALFGLRGKKSFDCALSEVGKREIYLYIEIEDAAGNVSDYTYSSTPLILEIRNKTGIADLKFEASDCMSVMEGSYEDLDADKVRTIKSLLSGDSLDKSSYSSFDGKDSHSYYSIAVSPNNAPTYTVEGFDVKDGNWKAVTDTGTLNVTIRAGRDNTPVDTSNLTLEIYDEIDENVWSQTPNFIVDKDSEEIFKKCFTDTNKDEENRKTVFECGEITTGNYLINLGKIKDARGGEKYVANTRHKVVIKGFDKKDVELASYEVYGFTILSNALSAVVTSNEKGSIEKWDFIGSASVDSKFHVEITDKEKKIAGESKALVYKFDYFDGHYMNVESIDESKKMGEYSKAETFVAGSSLTAKDDETWTYDIPLKASVAANTLKGKNVTIRISVMANNGEAKGEWTDFLLYSDGKPPVLKLTNESEFANRKIGRSSANFKEKNGQSYYELHGSVSDEDGSGVEKIFYSIDGTNYSEVESVPKVTIGADWNQSLQIADGDSRKIYVYAEDSVGNRSEPVRYENLTFDFSIPVVALSSPATVEEYYNKDVVLKFASEDGYKISSVAANVNGSSVTPSVVGAETKSATATMTVSGSDGLKTVSVVAKDALGQVSEECVVKFTMDKTAPKIDDLVGFGTKTNGYYTSSTIKIDGSCTENYGLKSVEYWITLPDGTNTERATQAAAGTSFSVTSTDFVSINGGKNVFHAIVTDLAGNKSAEKTTTVYVDQGAPALSVVYFDDNSDQKDLTSVPTTIFYGPEKPVNLTLYGLVSDEGGVDSVEFTLGGSKISPVIYYATDNLTENSSAASFIGANWTSSVTAENKSKIKVWRASFAESAISSALGSGADLVISAQDLSGQKTTAPNKIQFKKDSQKPTLILTNLSNGVTITEEDLTSDSFVIRGTWNDVGGSGTSVLECSVDGIKIASENIEAPKSTSPVSWSVSVPKSSIPASTGKSIFFTAKDAVGNITTENVQNVTFDYKIPTLTVDTVTEYYGYSASPLVIAFTGNDDRGIKEIKAISTKLNGFDASGCTFSNPDSNKKTATATIPRTGGVDYDGVWEITVVAFDLSNRPSLPVVVKTVVDGSKPAIPEIKYVGGTVYDPSNWCNNSVIQVSAVAKDEGHSGIRDVYYKVIDSTAAVPTDLVSSNDGSVAAVSGQQFNLTLSDINENVGTKFTKLLLQSVDKAGNKSAVAVAAINVDQTAPEVKSLYYTYDDIAYKNASGFVRTNGKTNMTLYGNIEEIGSGLESLTFNINGVDIPTAGVTLSYSSSKIRTVNSLSDLPTFDSTIGAAKSFKAVIRSAQLKDGVLSVSARDKASNTMQQTLFTIIKDSTAPAMTLKSPVTRLVKVDGANSSDTTAEKAVNGSVNVSGTTVDDELEKISLSYSVGDDTNWSTPVVKNGSEAYNWNFNLPMTTNQNGTLKFIDNTNYEESAKDIYVKLEAIDVAGNISTNIYKYVIDPNSDRPVISVGNISVADMSADNAIWVRSANIFGTITDDDGIKSFKYRVGPSGVFKDVTVSNGLWSIDLSDGPNLVYFHIEDKGDTVFESGKARCFTPILSDGVNTIADYSFLNTKVDTAAPTVTGLVYTVFDGKSYVEYSTNFATGHFGGEYSKIKFRFDMADSNGIKSVEVKFNDKRCYFKENPNSGLFETDGISLKNYPDSSVLSTGSCKAEIIVTDQAGIETTKVVNFIVDNTDPEVSITPIGDTVSSAATLYGSVNEIGGEVYFAVTKQGDSRPDLSSFADGDLNGANRWKRISNADLAWSVYFDDDSSNTEGTHTDLLKWYLTKDIGVGVTSDGVECTIESISDQSFSDDVPVTFHIMAVDSCKNRGYGKIDINVDPQGDKPKVSFTSPDNDSIQGGAIRVSGTATDNLEAKFVGLYIDVDHDGKWTLNDINLLKQDLANPVFGEIKSIGSTGKVSFNDVTTISSGLTDYSNYALKIPVSGSSWNVTINENEKFNPADGKSGLVKIWAFAVDGDGNTSKRDMSSDMMKRIEFTVDKDSPKISNIKLTQDGVERSYAEGIAIKGKWFYEADICDDQGIDKIEIDGISYKNYPECDATPINETGRKGYHIKFPVGKTTDGYVGMENHVIKYTEVKDVNAIEGTANVNLKIDNKKPEILSRGDVEYKIMSSMDGNIVNTGDFYTFGSVAKEDTVNNVNQTGVQRIAFYFTRDVDGVSELYDVMVARGKPENKISSYESLEKDDGLYWIKKTASNVSGSTITIDSASDNIHVGGLAKLNGVIYRIGYVSRTTVTLETTDELKPGNVFFAMANVVDNPVQEREGTSKNDAGYWTDVGFDDRDNMVESFIKSGSKWTWDASINTKNVGDGRAVLHYVVFDAAGNFASEDVEVFIGNNQPRIAGLEFSTDDNGDGKFTGNEVITQYHNKYPKGLSVSNKVTHAVFPTGSTDANPKTLATVHNGMRIRPEIVGGNGMLTYDAKIGSTSVKSGPLNRASGDSEGSQIEVSASDLENDTVNIGSVTLDVKTMVSKITDGKNQKFVFTVKDSTLGDSLSADIDIWLNFALKDSSAPIVRIIPLYWNGASKNSLYENSRANGHIELTSDIDVSKYPAGSLKDKDPKVSGKIKLEGIVHEDNGQVTAIKLNIAGKDENVASYVDGVWTVSSAYSMASGIPSGGLGIEICNVTYGDLLKTDIISDIPEDYSESDDIPYFTQEFNNLVKWIAYIDTDVLSNAKSGYSAMADLVIKAYASNRGSPDGSGIYSGGKTNTVSSTTISGGDAGEKATTDYYKMDIVPYITDVDTILGRKNRIPSLYGRTALGHYSVQGRGSGGNLNSVEEVTLTGFNLGSATKILSFDDVKKIEKDSDGSRPYSFEINGVSSINNCNNNDACGSYGADLDDDSSYSVKKEWGYNRMPNNVNNNNLTDDVVFDIWQINDAAVKPHDARIEQAVMKIRPSDGMVGFAFANGVRNFSMPSGKEATTDYSNLTWNRSYDIFSSVDMVFDKAGYSYAVAAAGDTNSGKSTDDYSFMTSRWGRVSANDNGGDGDNLGSNKHYRLEAIAQAGKKDGTDSTWYVDKQRVKSSSLATTMKGSSTNVYLAYYDSLNREIRFRHGSLSGTDVPTSGFGLFKDSYSNGNYDSYASNKTRVNIAVPEPTDESTILSPYVSIGAIPGQGVGGDDVVVMAWYEGGQLWFKYHRNPSAIEKDTIDGWKKKVAVFESDTNSIASGQYCKLVVDIDGGVHIASYDSKKQNLNYAYLPYENLNENIESSSFRTAVVDANGVVGKNITIDVAKVGNVNVPYIGYYSTSCSLPKTARLVKTDRLASGDLNGSKNDMYTGVWECSVVPSPSQIEMTSTQFNLINVGVHKTETGVLKEIPLGTCKVEKYNTNFSCKGRVYGNGTLNPMVGYVVKNGGSSDNIETAQIW